MIHFLSNPVFKYNKLNISGYMVSNKKYLGSVKREAGVSPARSRRCNKEIV